MPQIVIYHSLTVTGKAMSQPVTVPSDFAGGRVSLIVTAGLSDFNVFDIEVLIEASRDRGRSWMCLDRSMLLRTLVDGPMTPVNLVSSAVLPDDLAGKLVRAVISCGQSVLAASIVLEY